MTAQQGQVLLQRLADRSIIKVREIWNSPNFEHIQQIIRELIAQFVEITERGSEFLATNLRLNNFVDNFIRLLQFESKEKVRV